VVVTVLGAILPWLIAFGLPIWGVIWAFRRFVRRRPAMVAVPNPPFLPRTQPTATTSPTQPAAPAPSDPSRPNPSRPNPSGPDPSGPDPAQSAPEQPSQDWPSNGPDRA
jgi:hypothetical protein